MATALLPPVRYNVGVPNIDRLLGPLQEGLEQRRAMRAQSGQNALSRMVGERMAAGDLPGAARTAFEGGDLSTGMDITKMSKAEQEEMLGTIGRYAAMADTPEKWQRVVPILTQKFGPQFAQEYGDFETGREALLAETLELSDQFKLQEERRKSRKKPDTIKMFDPETGQEMTAAWDADQQRFVPVGGPKAPRQGITVRTLPDGTTETVIGGPAGEPLGKSAETTVQKKAINAAEMGSRVAGIMRDFKPEYQTLGTRFANMWRSMRARADPESLAPKERKGLEDFARYRSQAIGNVNRLLNELSGATVSPAEAERLKAEMPNPGTGLFDGDDPVTFKAKMETVMEQVQRSLRRYEFYQQYGTPASIEDVPLNDVKQINGKWYVRRGDKVFEVGDADQP